MCRTHKRLRKSGLTTGVRQPQKEPGTLNRKVRNGTYAVAIPSSRQTTYSYQVLFDRLRQRERGPLFWVDTSTILIKIIVG